MHQLPLRSVRSGKEGEERRVGDMRNVELDIVTSELFRCTTVLQGDRFVHQQRQEEQLELHPPKTELLRHLHCDKKHMRVRIWQLAKIEAGVGTDMRNIHCDK